MDVRLFHVKHLDQMRLQPSQAGRAHLLQGEEIREFLGQQEAYTAFVGDQPLAACGLMDIWPGRAMAWAFLDERAGPHMLAITRSVRRFLDLKAPRRTELYVDAGFEAGYRWANLLGFEREGFLRAFDVDGRNQVLYSRIRPCPTP